MKKALYLSVLFIAFIVCPQYFANAQGGVAINTAGALPDSSAVLDVSSATKGILVPRVTTLQRNAIAKPAKGLLIYNTDCDVYNYNAGTSASPNWVTSNSTNALVAGISILANPVGAICAGTNVIFTATPAGGINAPNYQWKVNGSNVGTNSTTFSDSTLSNGDVISCILSTNEACVTGSPATSNSITMTVNPIPSTPGVISGSTTVCPNFSGNVYSISPVAGATTYNWSVPGDAAITAGAGNTSVSVTFGVDSGNVSVIAVNSCGVSGQSSLPVGINYAPGTQTFTYTGGQQIFTVHACVSSITIAAYGAQGGGVYNNGGLGGSANGTLQVTPGQLLNVFVGGQNGYNGGGNGGGMGGGMSDVRIGGTSTGNWVIVAGGGGGGGNNGGGYVNTVTGTGGGGGGCANGAGGGGGGYATNGSAGVGGAGTCSNGGTAGYSNGGWAGGGGGGGLTSGGSGGASGGYGAAGGDGSQGQGGDAASGCGCGVGNTGGGGGGYYGGGGASAGCCAGGSGGGGSSWASSAMTNLSFFGGVQSGNGQVVITW